MLEDARPQFYDREYAPHRRLKRTRIRQCLLFGGRSNVFGSSPASDVCLNDWFF